MVSRIIVPVYEYVATYPVWRYQYSTNPDIQDGWERTGIAFYAFGEQQPGVVPIYQYHAEDPWRYLYSHSPDVESGWIRDGIAFYAYESYKDYPPDTIGVAQYYAIDPWRYLYTISRNGGFEGWTFETTPFLVFDASVG
jgi:hypothetical protein